MLISIIWYILCILPWYCTTVHSFETTTKKASFTALIFNQRTKQLDELSVDEYEKCRHCLIACPADSEQDAQFNENVSISKNSVFVKKVIDENYEYAKNIELHVCKEPFKPSMVYDDKMNTYEIGYELYYSEGETTMQCDKYDDYKSIFPELLNATNRSETYVSLNVTKRKLNKNTEFIFSDGSIRVFYWISVLSFKFIRSKYQIKINFKSDVVENHVTMIKGCTIYDLGRTLYQSEKEVNFFSSKISEKPESSLVQAQVIPIMFLHTTAAKLATCTPMNIIPVWDIILTERLKLIDQYLYTIFRMWSPNVNIIFGVSGALKVKIENLEKPSKYETISIPKLIYRIVEYRKPTNDPYNMYYIAIIIHNNLATKISQKERLCQFPSTSWDAITNEKSESGLSYACALLPTVNKKLGAYDKSELGSEFRNTLQLNIFPLTRKKNDSGLPYDDVRESITKKMKEFFPESGVSKN